MTQIPDHAVPALEEGSKGDSYSLMQEHPPDRRSWRHLDLVLDGVGVLSLLAAVPSLFAAVVAGWMVHDAITAPASADLQTGVYVAFLLLPISVGVAIASATIAGIRGGRDADWAAQPAHWWPSRCRRPSWQPSSVHSCLSFMG